MKIMWEIKVQYESVIQARRCYSNLYEKKEALIVYIDVPTDMRIAEKEYERVEKYQDLSRHRLS